MKIIVNLTVIVSLSIATSQCAKVRKVPKTPGAYVDREAAVIDVAPTRKGLLQRRRAHLIRNTLAKALVLNPQGLCLELGRIPCTDVVHQVSLGGMDAYGSSQYTYPAKISVTSPNSFDRVILSACIQRSGLDLINPHEGVIFKDVKLTVDGRLVLNDSIERAMNLLYQRVFLREASGGEISALKKLYEDIYAAEPIGAARNWMVLSCYAVLSSMEGVFY